MGNQQSSPLQHAAAHDDIDKVHALISESRIELNGTDKVGVSIRSCTGYNFYTQRYADTCVTFHRMDGRHYTLRLTGAATGS